MDKNDFDVLFRDFNFEEAEKFFKEKIPITKTEFSKLKEQYKGKAFTVAGYTDASIVNQFYQELAKAIETGTTVETFRENMNSFLQDKGLKGGQKNVTRYQADNIFRTNLQTAYNAGHYAKMTDPDVMSLRPYWQYIAIDDNCTRPTHRAMNGLVFRADDPIWDIWYPPNGYRCRCMVKSLSQRQVEQRGLTVMSGDLPITPDKGFHTNPAKQSFEPDISDYPESLKKAYAAKREEWG